MIYMHARRLPRRGHQKVGRCQVVKDYNSWEKKKSTYLNMLVTSIPTNITFTGNQILINLNVSGSVDITPKTLNVDTMITEIRFCNPKRVMCYVRNSIKSLDIQHIS